MLKKGDVIVEGSMKALIFKTKGEVALEERPIPQCPDAGILVKVARAGICGSDIHAYTKGGRYGGVGDGCQFGHEFVGTVVEVGKNCTDYAVGDRVWQDPTYCVADPRYCCMAGGFAEYAATINAIEGETVYKLPDEVSFAEAVLIEPFGVGVHCKNRGETKPSDKVILYGAGPIGLMAWAALVHQGNKNVIVAEQMPSRIAYARELGADVFDNSGDNDLEAYVVEKFGISNTYSYERPDVDVYLDCVGIGKIMGEYLEKGRCNSTFATLGLDQTPLTITPGEFMSKQFKVVGSRAYTPVDIREVIEVLSAKKTNIASIVTGEFSLEQADEAFATACDRNTGLKVVFNISD